MQGLTEGRIVHFVPPGGGQHQPAMVVSVRDVGSDGLVALQVFVDDDRGSVWVPNAMFSEDKEQYTWHWIEKA